MTSEEWQIDMGESYGMRSIDVSLSFAAGRLVIELDGAVKLIRQATAEREQGS
jgi:hypothetical protein